MLLSVPYSKGGDIVWTCVKDNIIYEIEYYESIGLCGFYYKLFEEEDGGGLKDLFQPQKRKIT